MVVMILEKVPPSLRGSLTRWLLEPQPGVFVGKVSALVREELWKMCLETRAVGGMVQIWSAANEQGFDAKTFGQTSRQLVNIEGLWFVRRTRKSVKDKEKGPPSNEETGGAQASDTSD